jgi:Ni,Fe-hydrogenase I cytochrome b subunit
VHQVVTIKALAIAILTVTGLYLTDALPTVSGDDPKVHA